MKLVIAEKPSVAQSIAKVIGATERQDGYLEGNGYIVSWCVGHLVELAEPEFYDEKYGARSIRREIIHRIEDRLSSLILEGKISPQDRVKISVTGDELVFVNLRNMQKAI